MNKFATVILTSLLALSAADASGVVVGGNKQKQAVNPNAVSVSGLSIVRENADIRVDMTLDANAVKVSSERELVYTPMLVNDADTARLESFIIAGRNRWLEHQRNDRTPAEVTVLRSGKVSQPIRFSDSTPWQPWMDEAKLEMELTECGCCSAPRRVKAVTIAQVDMAPKEFLPEMAFVTPKAEAVKMRSINARAYVDFPVNRTEIFPDYRRNPSELAKIRATIDSVRNDRDLSITSIHIKGFASPEGSYTNNERLAKGRTATLADYVRNLYHFDHNTITTSFQPEDWAGLIEYLRSDAAAGNVANRDAILMLCTDTRYNGRDDERERQIKVQFPADYAFLLENIYPGLRHSDYAVNFNVRSYTDPKEIIETMRTAPQNLSLQELFVAANSVEPGSEIYNEAFDIAARMYPDDETANLNAAFCALQRDDLLMAERYLEKAGKSEQAEYGRAILEAKRGDKELASQTMKTLRTVRQARKSAQDLDGELKSGSNAFTIVNDRIAF